jgi:hypothetical protein
MINSGADGTGGRTGGATAQERKKAVIKITPETKTAVDCEKVLIFLISVLYAKLKAKSMVGPV